MVRARFYRPIQNSQGDLVLNAQVRVLDANTGSPISEPLYSSLSGSTALGNPYNATLGVIDFYLDEPRYVDIEVTPSGGTPTTVQNLVVAVPVSEGAPSEPGEGGASAAEVITIVEDEFGLSRESGVTFVDRFAVRGLAAKTPTAQIAPNGTVTIDVTNRAVHRYYLTGSNSISSMTLSNAILGAEVTIIVTRNGSQSVVWPSNVQWMNGKSPEYSKANSPTLTNLYYDGSTWIEQYRSVDMGITQTPLQAYEAGLA